MTDVSSSQPAQPHDPYLALREPGFRYYLLGNALATIANEMQSTALGWELFQRTHSPMALGLVGFVQILPVVSLVLIAGHAADRLPRLRIIQAAVATQALCSMGLAACSFFHGPIPAIYACLFVVGVAMSFSLPARGAALPQIVPMSSFANAVVWRTTTWQLSACVGPALGGLALALVHAPFVIYACSSGLTIAACLLFFAVKPRPQIPSREPLSLASLFAGARFVASRQPLLAALTLDLFAVLFGGATALLPIFADEILKVGPQGLGSLRAAPSIGALIAALVIAHRRPFQRSGRVLLATVAAFGLATIIFGLSSSFYLSLAMLFLIGVFDNISVVIRATLVQTLTPDHMRGRVAAVNSVFVAMSNELGAFESGVAATFLGAVRAVVAGGAACFAIVGAVAFRWPEVRALGRLDEIS
jgi:MFS family permease